MLRLAAHRRRPPRRAPRGPRGGRRAQRERQFAAFRPTVDLAIAEKVDLFLVAGDLFDSNVQPRALGGARRRASSPGSPQARIRSVLVPGHPRRLRPLVGLPRLRPRGDGRHPPAEDDLVTVLTPDHPWVHLAGARRRRPRPVLPDEARAVQPAARPRRASRRPHATWQHRRAPRGRRDPRPHGPRRGRRHGRGDRRERPRLPRARPLARARRSRKTKGVTYAYAGRARAGRRRPGQGRQGAPRDARRRKTGAAHGRGRGARRSARRRSSAARSTRRRSSRSRPSSRSSKAQAEPGPRPRRPRSSASGPTRSTSTPPRSRQALRASYLRVRVRDVEPSGPDGGRAAARRDDRRARSSATSRAGSPTSRRPATTWLARGGRGAARRAAARPPPARGLAR